MHIGSSQDHTMDHTRVAAGLSLLSVGCFPNQSALLHCGPNLAQNRESVHRGGRTFGLGDRLACRMPLGLV